MVTGVQSHATSEGWSSMWALHSDSASAVPSDFHSLSVALSSFHLPTSLFPLLVQGPHLALQPALAHLSVAASSPAAISGD